MHALPWAKFVLKNPIFVKKLYFFLPGGNFVGSKLPNHITLDQKILGFCFDYCMNNICKKEQNLRQSLPDPDWNSWFSQKISLKFYLQSNSKAMDRGKKRGRQKYKNLSISRMKSFSDEIKNIFHSFSRAIIWWEIKIW